MIIISWDQNIGLKIGILEDVCALNPDYPLYLRFYNQNVNFLPDGGIRHMPGKRKQL